MRAEAVNKAAGTRLASEHFGAVGGCDTHSAAELKATRADSTRTHRTSDRSRERSAYDDTEAGQRTDTERGLRV